MSNTNGSLASVDGAAHVIGLVPKNLYNISHTQAESCVEWKPKFTDTYVCLSHSYTIEEMATSVLCLFHFYRYHQNLVSWKDNLFNRLRYETCIKAIRYKKRPINEYLFHQ